MSVGLASPGLVSPGLSPDEAAGGGGGGSVFNPLSGRGGGAAQPITVIDMHIGDFDASAVIYGKFTTFRPSTGAAYTLGGTPALSVYKDGSTTQSTTGVTLTADFDSVTGLNHFAIDTSADGTFYASGSFFDIVITTGTVDSVSVVGSVVGRFTIRKTSSLKPTTAGRTLDVSSGGEAGLDWANVGNPTTSVNLSGTTVSTTQAVASVSGAVGSVTGNVGGNVTGSVGSIATGGISAASFAAGAVDAAALAADAGTEIGTAVWASAARTLTALDEDSTTLDLDATIRAAVGMASANLDTQLTAIDDYLDTEVAAIKAKTDNLPASPAATGDIPTAAAIADAVWDEAIAGHAGAGSTGEALSAAGAAGDPWITALPGSYSAGQAGYIVGTNLNATVSSRATQTSVDTVDDFLDTEIAAIKAKTDNLPASPAAVGDIPTALQNADALLNRDMSAVSDTNSRSPLNALRHIRNKWSASGTTLTVTKEDDTTTAWTSTLTTNPSAEPITGSDPA